MNPASSANQFRRSLFAWYRKNGRDLPWRRTRDPYAILVSEFMLQQTQVATVIPHYNEWMRRFPDFAALAAASERDVLHAWQGLGYYRRARNLLAAAKIVVGKFRGEFPRSIDTIQSLPGIGRYTANAIASFAFNRSVPIVEANTARLIARLSNLQIPIDTSAGREALWRHATQLVSNRSGGMCNSALLDLGALICIPRQPKCGICPVEKFCRARDPSHIPIKKARPATRRSTEQHTFAIRRGRVLLEQSEERWHGMWILPRVKKTSPKIAPVHISEFPFTNHRITLAVFSIPSSALSANRSHRWFPIGSLNSIPIPSPHRRALAKLVVAQP